MVTGEDAILELMQYNGMSDVRLVLVERNEHSNVQLTLRSDRELEEELESSMRRSLLVVGCLIDTARIGYIVT